MNNALAALFGAVGGGARSYGQNTMREEQQAAMEQQRMNELKQQEQARIAQTRAAAEAAAAAKLQQRTAGVNSIKALFPDFEAPEGDFDPGVVMSGMQQREQTKRTEMGQAGSMERLEKTLGGRLDQIEKQGGISRGIADANNTSRAAIAALLERGRGERDNGPTDRLGEMTAKRAMELMQPTPGKLGLPDTPGLSGPEARARAEQEVQAAYGRPNVASPAAPAYTAKPQNAEGDLMQKLNAAIQQINALPIDAQEKQARIQEANRRATERARQMRGGA